MILAGDVGGTKVHLALYDFINGKLEYTRDERYPAKNYSGLEEIVKEFLGADKVTAACFGVPGPVRNGRLRLTNLPWTLDSHELCAGLGVDHVFLINDLEANGYGIAELSKEQICTLSEGDASQTGNRTLIAAGTGLGECFLVWNGRTHIPNPSEGGHADYGPRNEDEIVPARSPRNGRAGLAGRTHRRRGRPELCDHRSGAGGEERDLRKGAGYVCVSLWRRGR